jgi:cysteinyl-tRNA synthetase
MTVLGIDEKTGLVIDLKEGQCKVLGSGSVTVIRDGYEAQFTKSQAFSITQLGDFRVPEPRAGLPQQVFQQALNAQQSLEQSSQPPAEVLRLVEEREVARQRRAWAQADALRAQIAALGWQVVDTQDGSVLERVS